MRQAYVALSFQHRQDLTPIVDVIRDCLRTVGVNPVVFVELYQFDASQEREMMTKAFDTLKASEVLIAEVSHKSIGIGIEIGYAVGHGLPIIYLKHQDAEHSTTVGGVATHYITYTTPADLKESLQNILRTMNE